MRPGPQKEQIPVDQLVLAPVWAHFWGFLCHCGAHRVPQGHGHSLQHWGFGPEQRKPSLGGSGALCTGNQSTAGEGTGISCCTSLKCQRHPGHPQGTNMGSGGHQWLPALTGGRWEKEGGITALFRAGNRREVLSDPKVEYPLLCSSRTADTFQGQESGWRERK